ncbi:MAG TPA: polysaccharide deacetylase family protein [Candidatus Binataceae bacterium]|nr:polysaccharide deacetylase family protein [Candidatus Binataceae bacterium]
MARQLPILMYHSIGSGDRDEVPQPWSRFHSVPYRSFLAQLDTLVGHGYQSIPLAKLNQAVEITKPIAITFDDGHSSDLIAAEALHDRGLRAIFFITWSNLDRRDFLKPSEVRDLDRIGFDIGSHGLTHVPLTDESPADLRRQLVESKDRLEHLLGKSVDDFAIPFGRYNKLVVETAIGAGYQRIMTSDFGCAQLGSDAIVFPRMGITRETTLADFKLMLTARWFDIARQKIALGISRRLRNLTARAHTSRSVVTG